MEREGALRNALKRDDELLPYFQPIVDVRAGEIVALEALIRWQQPDGSVVGPGEFLPAVEAPAAHRAARPVHAHARRGHPVGRAVRAWPPVHVNCSSYSMTRPEFADEVLALLRRHGVAPSRVCLELTEGALVAEPDLARRTMQRLADNGCRSCSTTSARASRR